MARFILFSIACLALLYVASACPRAGRSSCRGLWIVCGAGSNCCSGYCNAGKKCDWNPKVVWIRKLLATCKAQRASYQSQLNSLNSQWNTLTSQLNSYNSQWGSVDRAAKMYYSQLMSLNKQIAAANRVKASKCGNRSSCWSKRKSYQSTLASLKSQLAGCRTTKGMRFRKRSMDEFNEDQVQNEDDEVSDFDKRWRRRRRRRRRLTPSAPAPSGVANANFPLTTAARIVYNPIYAQYQACNGPRNHLRNQVNAKRSAVNARRNQVNAKRAAVAKRRAQGNSWKAQLASKRAYLARLHRDARTCSSQAASCWAAVKSLQSQISSYKRQLASCRRLPVCPKYHVRKGTRCVRTGCPAGQIRRGAHCSVCPSRHVARNNRCVRTSCPHGMVLRHGDCVRPTRAPRQDTPQQEQGPSQEISQPAVQQESADPFGDFFNAPPKGGNNNNDPWAVKMTGNSNGNSNGNANGNDPFGQGDPFANDGPPADWLFAEDASIQDQDVHAVA